MGKGDSLKAETETWNSGSSSSRQCAQSQLATEVKKRGGRDGGGQGWLRLARSSGLASTTAEAAGLLYIRYERSESDRRRETMAAPCARAG